MTLEELETRAQELAEAVENGETVDITEVRSITKQLDTARKAQAEQEEARSALLNAKPGRPAPAAEIETRTDETRLDTRSTAEQFANDPQLVEIRNSGSGRPIGAFRRTFDTIETRALITTAEGGVTQNTRVPGIVPTVMDRPLGIVDLIERRPISSNGFEVVREISTTPQGTPGVVAEGATKPESTYEWEVVPDTVRTVAHWTKASRQVLDDEPQLQGLIRDRLFYGLGYYVDAQILNGTGASGSLTGIVNTTGVNTYDAGSGNTEAAVISLRKAMTQVELDHYQANVVALNPLDWETIELSQDDNGQWRVTQNPQAPLTRRIWGMNVVSTKALAQGTFVLGDFKQGATLYDRQQANLAITDSDGTDFQKNIITLRAELRLGLGVERPSAFCVGVIRGNA